MIRWMTAIVVSVALAQPVAGSGPESWIVAVDLWGNRQYRTLELVQDGSSLSGSLGGDRIEGESEGSAMHFVAIGSGQSRMRFDAERTGDTMRGMSIAVDPDPVGDPVKHAFSGWRIPARPQGPPRLHDYIPADYSNTFSADRSPVLVVWPGDSVRTTTVDSGGVDKDGVTRALFGNPQTGPFFVGSAGPGDTLVVHITRLALNRDSADSLDSIVGRALPHRLAAQAAALGKPVRWALDTEAGTAGPETPGERLRDFTVPLRPMLGGLAVAPDFGYPPMSTGDTGRFGGNMDFNEIVEGSTVFLPVSQPGALLYLGDAHALQGDGETSQFALETSMDVEFRVDVIHGIAPSTPRVETGTHISALGQAGSLDEALRAATSGLIDWLQEDFGLDLSECAQVIGTTVEYRVVNLAGRNVGIAARIDKSRLAGLHRIRP